MTETDKSPVYNADRSRLKNNSKRLNSYGANKFWVFSERQRLLGLCFWVLLRPAMASCLHDSRMIVVMQSNQQQRREGKTARSGWRGRVHI